MLRTPKELVLQSINPLDYFKAEYPTWDGSQTTQVACPQGQRHEKGSDDTPSLSINPDTGEFFCHGCGWSGTSVLGYHTDVHCGGNFRSALGALYARYVKELIPNVRIKRFVTNLQRDARIIKALGLRRGWLPETLQQLRIGWDPPRNRITIPIFNQADHCLDVRFHDALYRAPLEKGKRAAVLAMSEAGRGEFFPVNGKINPFSVDRTEIWCVEGEADAISGFQEGLNVVTVTGGGTAWGDLGTGKYNAFDNKDVIFLRDADEAGLTAAKEFAAKLVGTDASSLKVIFPPKGKDLNEYLVKYSGNIDNLRQVAISAPYTIHPRKQHAALVPLGKTSDAQHYGSWLSTDVLVNGQHHSPFVIPRRIEYSCAGDRCATCPSRDTGKAEFAIQKDDPRILEWIYTNPSRYADAIKQDMQLAKGCDVHARVVEYQNLQQVTCIPALTTKRSEDVGSYVMRTGFCLHGSLETNQQYRAVVKPLLHPRTKESVLLVDKATGSADSIKLFKLSKNDVEELRTLFSGTPGSIIKDVCHMLAHNHTKIYGRPDLHAAIDLTFHSPRNFSFAGVSLPRTGIELLVLGDTRCGKGQVAEGIVSFYDLGTVVSGENTSFMGLAGGATKVGDSFSITWGAIPLNNGRLVIVDECSDISTEVFGRLSRVRSEGVVEIAKGGIIAKTHANTRLIWICNPRDGREISAYGSGVQAILHLIKNHEDIARFDFALVVAKGEVNIEKINLGIHKRVASVFTQEQLRKIVLWVWSRKPEQIHFTEEATKFILESSVKLAGQYSATIPLIQGENARFKLAKLAAAVAGRCFSTEDGNSLTIRLEHAKTAVSLIHIWYDKPIMGYRQYSRMENDTQDLANLEELNTFFELFSPADRGLLIDGLLSLERFKVLELQDLCGTDGTVARKHVSLLVKCRAIRQHGAGVYGRKPAFTRYLKEMKRGLERSERIG